MSTTFSDLIGICIGHGEWFSLDDEHHVTCPRPGCRSDVYLYERAGLTHSTPRPSSQQRDDGDLFGVVGCTCRPRPSGGWAMKLNCSVHGKYVARREVV